MPRLLFVIHEDAFFCSHRLNLGRAARDAGYEVSVATHVQHHAKPIEDAGFKLLPIRLHGGVQSPFHELASLIELIRLYRREQPDIIHHVSLKPALFGSIAARIVGAPAVVNAVTGLGYLFQSEGWRRSLLRSTLVPALRWGFAHPRSVGIFQNQDDRENFVGARLVKKSQTVIIRGSGVNISHFRPTPEPSGVPVVVLASRMLWDKGIGEFVEAARLVKARGIRAKFVLAGSVYKNNPTTITEEQLRQWEAEGVVEWWGHREDMAGIFAASHVVVLPSYGEGLPKVLLEAAACARPVIATNVRGCREIVRDGENGLLVPVKDPHLLAQAITRILDDKALRERMGARGREIVMKEFRVELVEEATMTLYRRLLGITRTGPIERNDSKMRAFTRKKRDVRSGVVPIGKV